MNSNHSMVNKDASDQPEKRPRIPGSLRAIVGLMDFMICVYLIALFFHGEIPGKQQFREGFRQVYSFVLNPENLLITTLLGGRLLVYGVSRVLKLRSISKYNQ